MSRVSSSACLLEPFSECYAQYPRVAPVDRLGDGLANGGEYNRRHNKVLNATYQVVQAGAAGAIVLGDKEDPAKTARSKGPGAIDRTHYGQLRGSTRSFLRHHTQQLVKAAVVGDSEAILRKITTLKQSAFGAASAATGGSVRGVGG